jgi:hypothetical protein
MVRNNFVPHSQCKEKTARCATTIKSPARSIPLWETGIGFVRKLLFIWVSTRQGERSCPISGAVLYRLFPTVSRSDEVFAHHRSHPVARL